MATSGNYPRPREVAFSIGTAKVSESGKIYGSVTTAQIADALVALGLNVDKKDITINEAVKELGVYEATVNCYKDIKGTAKFEVVAE